MTPMKRFIVGKCGDGSRPIASFDTEDEAALFISTLPDKEGVARGDYYLDDMNEGDE